MTAMNRPLALLAGLGLALGAAAYAPATQARTHVSVGVGIALPPPPPPRIVRVPPPRAGYVWAPGYWRWDARVRHHVWVDGYWVRARPGHHYRPARWVHEGHDWRFHPGRWDR